MILMFLITKYDLDIYNYKDLILIPGIVTHTSLMCSSF